MAKINGTYFDAALARYYVLRALAKKIAEIMIPVPVIDGLIAAEV